MKPRPCIKRSLYAFICLIYFNFLCFAVKKKKNSDCEGQTVFNTCRPLLMTANEESKIQSKNFLYY